MRSLQKGRTDLFSPRRAVERARRAADVDPSGDGSGMIENRSGDRRNSELEIRVTPGKTEIPGALDLPQQIAERGDRLVRDRLQRRPGVEVGDAVARHMRQDDTAYIARVRGQPASYPNIADEMQIR